MKRLAAFLLTLMMLISLAACAEKNAADGGSVTKKAEETGEPLWRKDEALLREQGYNVSYTTSNLYAFEGVVNAESGALSGIITATHDTEGVAINIYYFKSEDQAAKGFAGLDQNNFKLVGPRIVHGDRDNLIHN